MFQPRPSLPPPPIALATSQQTVFSGGPRPWVDPRSKHQMRLEWWFSSASYPPARQSLRLRLSVTTLMALSSICKLCNRVGQQINENALNGCLVSITETSRLSSLNRGRKRVNAVPQRAYCDVKIENSGSQNEPMAIATGTRRNQRLAPSADLTFDLDETMDLRTIMI